MAVNGSRIECGGRSVDVAERRGLPRVSSRPHGASLSVCACDQAYSPLRVHAQVGHDTRDWSTALTVACWAAAHPSMASPSSCPNDAA